jgi:hypothetical protein
MIENCKTMKMIILPDINQKNGKERGCTDESRPEQMMPLQTQNATLADCLLPVVKEV